MSFRDDILQHSRPTSIRTIALPRRVSFFPSPGDWRDEVLYFLLPDRFSDGSEQGRPILDRNNLPGARPADFRFDRWAQGGEDRWQGGTIRGITSKIDYLKGLGVTCLWVGPVFKQRGHLNTYHGYAIQDFLEVDPHFGTRPDLVELVDTAHAKGLRVMLDIIFNHSGHNWDYTVGENPAFKPWPGFYDKGPLDRWQCQAVTHKDGMLTFRSCGFGGQRISGVISATTTPPTSRLMAHLALVVQLLHCPLLIPSGSSTSQMYGSHNIQQDGHEELRVGLDVKRRRKTARSEPSLSALHFHS